MSEGDYVVFHFGVAENASDSPCGRVGGAQTVRAATLGFNAAAIIHEIGHAVGLWHEQSRQDRDDFVDVNGSNVQDGQTFNFDQHTDDGDEIGPYDYGSIMHYGRNYFAKNPLVDTLTPISWFGNENQAGGTAIGDISRNGQPDLVIFHVDNPAGANTGYYRILWDLDKNGKDQGGLSDIKPIPGWFGDETQGGGIALQDVKRNGNLDLIVFFVDNAGGGNQGYYRIGWNLDVKGNPASWSVVMKVPGWFGNSTQGHHDGLHQRQGPPGPRGVPHRRPRRQQHRLLPHRLDDARRQDHRGLDAADRHSRLVRQRQPGRRDCGRRSRQQRPAEPGGFSHRQSRPGQSRLHPCWT
jgi:hypothetical protein